MEARQNKPDPEDTEQTEGQKQNHHGRHRFAGSTDGTRQRVKNGKQPIKGAEIPHGDLPEVDDRGILGEKAENRAREEQQQRAGNDRVYNTHAKGHPHALFYALQISGAVILPHEGCDRHTKAQNRKDIEAVDL